MNKTRAFLPLFLLLGSAVFCADAEAQVEMYPGQDVTVNPQAAGTQVLLYPGGQYMRVVPHLREPGAHPYAPIHLHMPAHHPVHVAAAPKPDTATQTADESDENSSADTTAGAAPPAKKPEQTASTETPPPAANTGAKPASDDVAAPADDTAPASAAAIPFSLDSSSPPPAPAPTQASSKPAKPSKKPQTQLASTELPPASTNPKPVQQSIAPTSAEMNSHAGLTKRSEIIFEAGSSDPAPSTLGAIKSLAGTLEAAIKDGAQRIQLEAYGGARHDKSSDARRLSLKRALSIRQILIDDGVPAERIDVRAMGGADDKGPTDRVDVFVRAG